MKSLVVYDSNYGNTKLVAETIAKVLGGAVKHVKEADTDEIEVADLLIVGSPINGWMATEDTRNFLTGLERLSLEGKSVAAFDTRVQVFYHGDAMAKIKRALIRLGGKSVTEPMSFFVAGKEGPLLDGETEKVKRWAQDIKSSLEKRK